MLKLLIVDDEPDICELIYKLISWDELGLLSLGAVQNGVDALEIILRQKPDIVITDIQMPGITGLELVKKARQMDVQTSFIVISGYREFEYAQQAIHFGVEEYLLKPISKTDLNLVLKRLIQEQDTLQEQYDHQENLRAELERKTAILRGNELRQTVMDSDRHFRTELFHFQDGEYLAICVHASFRNKAEINRGAILGVLGNVAIRIQEKFRGECYDSEYVLNDCNAYILINYSEDEHCTYKERRDGLQMLLREVATQYQNLCVTFAMGEPCCGEAEIGWAVRSAEIASMLRLYAGLEKVIEYQKLRKMLPDEPACVIDSETQQRLLLLTETLKKEEALALIRSTYGEFQNMESYDLWKLFQVSRSLVLYLRYELSSLGFREETCPPLENGLSVPLESDIHEWLANSDTIWEIRDLVSAYVSAEIDYCASLQRQKVGEPIRIAQEYIQANIERQISLEEVAAQTYVSPGYLSTLFKERTGKNFSDYVIEKRVEEAKSLLRGESLSMNEIAQRVGYADARHFSKVFQKIVGVKPTAYRKFYL